MFPVWEKLDYFVDMYFKVEAGVEHHTGVSDRRLKVFEQRVRANDTGQLSDPLVILYF